MLFLIKKMVALFILLGIFSTSLLCLKVFGRRLNYCLAARIALTVMLLFTAVTHFVYTDGMQLMLPNWIPFKKSVVLISGFIEIAIAVAICIRQLRKIAAWILIVFFIMILPANIWASMMQVDFQKATHLGPGIEYLWFRIPLQLLFIGWTYGCCLSRKLNVL